MVRFLLGGKAIILISSLQNSFGMMTYEEVISLSGGDGD